MYMGRHQKSADYFGQEIPILSDNSKKITIVNPFDLQNDPIDCHFQDIFCGNFAPNISTVSNSTRSDISFENFDLSSDFFIDDCLQQDPYFQGHKSVNCGTSGQKTQRLEIKEKEQKKQNCDIEEEINEENQEDALASAHDETKNIPKNFIKAIFTFILENKDYLQKMFQKITLNEENGAEIARFIDYIKTEKKTKKYTIQRLKALWKESSNGKAMRIISNEFLRKRALGYIFGSKIEKKIYHVKYRYKFIRAIENPDEFTNIK